MAQVTNLTVEAGREAVLRCISTITISSSRKSSSSSRSSNTSSSTASELKDKTDGEPEQGDSNTSKSCKWELDGKEMELSSTRHTLSFDQSHVSLDYLTE